MIINASNNLFPPIYGNMDRNNEFSSLSDSLEPLRKPRYDPQSYFLRNEFGSLERRVSALEETINRHSIEMEKDLLVDIDIRRINPRDLTPDFRDSLSFEDIDFLNRRYYEENIEVINSILNQSESNTVVLCDGIVVYDSAKDICDIDDSIIHEIEKKKGKVCYIYSKMCEIEEEVQPNWSVTGRIFSFPENGNDDECMVWEDCYPTLPLVFAMKITGTT